MNHEEVIKTIRDWTDQGKIKTKGAYEVLPFDKLGFHKNHSAMVVPMAVLAHMLELDNYENFILEHKDKFDFFLRVKVPRSSKLFLFKDDKETQLQNICRYYPSVNGGKLIKRMPPLEFGGEWRDLGVDTDYLITPCNQIKEFCWGTLDYNYYVNSAKKLINGLMTGEGSEGYSEENED